MGPVADIIVLVVSMLGIGLTYWRLSYRIGKTRGEDSEKMRAMSATISQLKQDQKQHDNRMLRIFQAIEELRRRAGNGSKEWYDLTGGQ